MALIKKSDLKLDYDWSNEPGNTPVDKDTFGDTVFDRQNGNDVLGLINSYSDKRKTTNKEEVLRAEPLIRNKLPKDIDTKEDAMNWLWDALGNKEDKRRV